MFEKLEGTDKQSNVFVDEIYVKPGVQFQGGPLKGFVMRNLKTSRNSLALMGASLMGQPSQ